MLVWFVACGPGFDEDYMNGARHLSTVRTSSSSGVATVRLKIEPGETAFLATPRIEAPNEVHVRGVYDAQGSLVFDAFEWNDADQSKTNAGFVAQVVSMNWPILGSDPGLTDGRWTLEIGTVDASRAYVPATFLLDVFLKSDADFEGGAVDVSVVYAGGLDADEALRDAVDEALVQWSDLYAPIGIEVRSNEYAYPNGSLAPPAFGEETAYIDIASDTAPRSVNLVLTEDIEGIDDVFGIAGDIPGPLVPTARSAVQISALFAAGPDGEFNDEELRLLAETMAHETGHYLGLFHPVETTWDTWDAVPDTEDCDGEDRCQDVLGENLMFPYPLCGPISCQPQPELTSDQAAVANRYTGVF